LFINGFIYIFILKNETEFISLNCPRFFTQKIGGKCEENISGYHLKWERIQACSIFWYMTTSLCFEFSFSFSSDSATMYNTGTNRVNLSASAYDFLANDVTLVTSYGYCQSLNINDIREQCRVCLTICEAGGIFCETMGGVCTGTLKLLPYQQHKPIQLILWE